MQDDVKQEISQASLELEQSRHITRGISSLTIQNLATSALGFIYLAVLLRLLPDVDYGIYSAMAVTVGIASVIAPMGLQYAAAKFLADIQDIVELRSRAKKIVMMSLFTSIIAFTVFIVLAGTLSIYFTKSPKWSDAFIIGGVWLFTSSLSSVVQGTVQGLKKYTSLAGMLFVARVVMVVFTIGSLELTHNLYDSFYAWIIYFAILIVWSIQILVKSLPRASQFKYPPSTDSLTYRDLLKYCVPLGIAGIFFVLTTEVDLVVVGGDMNPTSLGIYNTAVTISNVLNFVLIAPLVTTLLPEASLRIKNPFQISNGMRLAIRFVFLSVLPASFLMAAVSPQLLELFSGGTRYSSGAKPLEIIAVFYVFFAVQYVIYSILQAKGNTVLVLAISAISAVTIFGLSEILVPPFGLIGASVARSVSAIVGMIAACYLARDFLRKIDGSKFYVKALISSAIPFIVIWSLTTFVSDRDWTIIPYTAIGGLIFVACLLLTRVLTKEDKAFIFGAMPASIRGKIALLNEDG